MFAHSYLVCIRTGTLRHELWSGEHDLQWQWAHEADPDAGVLAPKANRQAVHSVFSSMALLRRFWQGKSLGDDIIQQELDSCARPQLTIKAVNACKFV